MPDATNRVVEEATPSPEAASRAGAAGDAPTASFPRGIAAHFSGGEILSRQEFLKQLQLEKRRTDRTQSPLSLVVLRVEPERGGGFDTVNVLLDLLGRRKRETDILGHIAKDQVGLLLPHTSQQGVQALIGKISPSTGRLPISIASSTYPDHLFENLLSDEAAAPSTPDSAEQSFREEARRSRLSVAVKRTVDVFASLCALIILMPLMLLIAVAIGVSSPGPVIFRQTRLGRGGTPFVFYKFRSMRADADDRIHREYVANLIEGNLESINQGDEERPLYKLSADPRITAVGRFIRRTSLDELPQLFNVLKGDMSLVGPRPPLPYEAEKYQSWHLRRLLEVRPGITGLWQVEGRSTTSFDDMVRLDLRYVRNRSLRLDLKILLKTVRVLFGSRGAT
jgi:exopolysaccharide biosynthesis polyprenyl glycosylphosphotransferase